MDEINVSDVALIFEGGGTRAANTAGVLTVLLENGIFFKDAFGISAGSTHVVNYISRDKTRSRASFVEFMGLPGIVGMMQFLRGKGYFNAHSIYQLSGHPDGLLPFNFKAFMESSTDMHIGSYEVDTDSTQSWTKTDVHCLQDLMNRVQASSSMPLAMPIVRFDGHLYYDGGLGDSWGIQLEEARALGYKRFFVLCTQERGFRKKRPRYPLVNYLATPAHLNVAYRHNHRWKHYNSICDQLDELEDSGYAIVYRPDEMPVRNTCNDIPTLARLYEQGYMKAYRELPRWKEFLGL